MLYSLSNLARIALKRNQPINFTFPLRNTYTVFGKTALFVIAFLDGWSSPANGPTFVANAPPGNEIRRFPPNDVLSCPSLTSTAAAPHLLAFDAAPFRQAVENRTAPPGPRTLADVKATLRCNWDSDPYSAGNEIARRTESTDYDMDLFTTGSSENGTVQYYLRGQCKVLQGNRPRGMALTTTMQLALTCDKAADVLLFSGSQNGDIAGLFNLQLMPNAKYRLSVNFIASAQFNYHATSGRLYRLFPPMATSRTRSDSSSPRSGSSVPRGPDTRRPSNLTRTSSPNPNPRDAPQPMLMDERQIYLPTPFGC
jgi:hypothetical protein